MCPLLGGVAIGMGVARLCKTRFYQFPGLKLIHKLKGHKKEVDDIACHPDTHTVQNNLS